MNLAPMRLFVDVPSRAWENDYITVIDLVGTRKILQHITAKMSNFDESTSHLIFRQCRPGNKLRSYKDPNETNGDETTLMNSDPHASLAS